MGKVLRKEIVTNVLAFTAALVVALIFDFLGGYNISNVWIWELFVLFLAQMLVAKRIFGEATKLRVELSVDIGIIAILLVGYLINFRVIESSSYNLFIVIMSRLLIIVFYYLLCRLVGSYKHKIENLVACMALQWISIFLLVMKGSQYLNEIEGMPLCTNYFTDLGINFLKFFCLSSLRSFAYFGVPFLFLIVYVVILLHNVHETSQKIRKRAIFSICDYLRLQEYLEKMAAKGFMIVCINEAFYVFKKTEPRKIRFLVDVYNMRYAYTKYGKLSWKGYLEYYRNEGWNYVCGNTPICVFVEDRADAIQTRWSEQMIWRLLLDHKKKTKISVIIQSVTCSILVAINVFEFVVLDGFDLKFGTFQIYMLLSLANLYVYSVSLHLRNIRYYKCNKSRIENNEALVISKKGESKAEILFYRIYNMVAIAIFIGFYTNFIWICLEGAKK